MQTSVAKIWTKFEPCLCTRPRGAWNKFCALFPASCVCNGPAKLRYWACQSATMAMRGCSWAEVVFLTCAVLTRQHAACASNSNSITLAGPVSPRNLKAACLCVKVEPITILTESPALNWPCAVFASPPHYNVITLSDVTVETGAGSTHARELPSPVRACVVRALRGVGLGEVGTQVAQHWVQLTGECGSLWLAKYKQIACQSPGWSRLNKYSKISNSCVSFESNRIASNYSIGFEISNIHTALLSIYH